MPARHRDHRERRFEQLFHNLGTGIAVADVDGRFVEVNPAFCATVGYTTDQLADMSVLMLTHPEDRAHNRELIGELLAGRRESFTIEKRYVTGTGSSVWVRAHVSLVEDAHGERQLVATTQDITPQKSAEARLADSEALLRIAGGVGRFGGWAIDTDPVRNIWSDEVNDLAGHPRGPAPPLDEAMELYHPGDRQRVAEAVRACMDEAVPFELEATFLPVGGEPLRVRVVGEPRLGDDGSVARIQGAIMDVSEQHRAQQRTEQLAERLRTTLASITDALYTIDTDWRFTYLNERAQQLLERPAEELIGRTVWETFPEIRGTALERAYRDAVADGRTVVLDEYHYPPLEGYFSINVYPSPQGLAVYFRDVTARRATRVELEERGARLAEQAALLDAAQDAIVVRDLDGRISYWNDSAERIYGWSAEEAIGRRLDELLSIDPRVYAGGSQRLLAQGRWVEEVDKVARDGRELTVEARWTLVRDEHGRPLSVLGIDTDITERKRIEQQFLRSQRFESIGKLAGGIAHDLNNALAPIGLSIELLREDEEDATKLRMLDIIHDSARHGAELVSQVLSFARGVEGRREPIAVGDVIEEVRRISADTFPKSIAIEADVPDGLWHVVGDPTQLQQVLINLCVNARDAMADGGTLRLSAANVHPDPDDLPAGAEPAVAIRVTDTGAGIPADVIEKMFEPFFSTKAPGEGTGLGLSTSAVIVAGHEGRIEVDSEPGVGTRFEIHLPAAWSASDVAPPTTAFTRQGDNDLVLVVDDDPAVRDLTRAMLERHGYRVLDAADGEAALALVDFHHAGIAVVITDLVMPVMDGYAVIEGVHRIRASIPVIASSGLHTSEAAERSLATGAARFLAKPYDAHALLTAIGEILDRHLDGPRR